MHELLVLIFAFHRYVSINTELLCIYKEDLSPDLRKTLILCWDNIKSALKRFNYYFGHFTEQQITECCTFSKIKQYNLDDVIYDSDTKQQLNTSFFVLSGQCIILQCLDMTSETIEKPKNLKLNEMRKTTKNVKVLPQKFRRQNNEDREKVPINSKITKSITETKKEMVFIDVATLSAGSIFGIGEKMEQRSIVAKNIVQCLEIPTFWLLERSQNIGNIWQRTKIFYTVTIPSRENILADHQRTCKWNQYKEKAMEV